MSTQAIQDIKSMHEIYVRMTGLNVPLDMGRELQWHAVWMQGVRPDDIRLVIDHMKRKAKAQQPHRSFTFRSFVGNADYLVEDIAEAKAANRTSKVHPNRAGVLRATGRPPAPEPPPSRPVGEILTNDQILSRLAKLKEEL